MGEETKNVPELRFPEFEGAWEEKRLGDVAEFSKGKGVSKSDIVDNGRTPCIRYGELYTEYGVNINNVTSRTNAPISGLILSEGGEVIVPASGEMAIDIATASVVWASGVALGGDLNIIRSELEGYFLASYISGKKRAALAAVAQGNSVVHLYPAQLGSLRIGIPTLSEQKKIAAFLSAVDDRLKALRKKRDLLSDYKRGIMQQILAQKIRFKRDDGTAFPDWEDFKAGHMFRNVSNKNHFVELPVLSITQNDGAVLRDEIDIDIKYSIENLTSYKIVEIGDFIISLRSFQGGIEYSNVNGLCSPAYTVLKPDVEIVDAFYAQFFKSQNFISRLSATVIGIRDGKQISYSSFSSLKLPYPHPDEQQKIADFLSALDDKITAVSKQITLTETFKNGLLQKMFA